jgi:hypothetical protein
MRLIRQCITNLFEWALYEEMERKYCYHSKPFASGNSL